MEHVTAEVMLKRLEYLEKPVTFIGLNAEGIREYNFLLAFKVWLDNVDYQVSQFERMYEHSYKLRTYEGSVK